MLIIDRFMIIRHYEICHQWDWIPASQRHETATRMVQVLPTLPSAESAVSSRNLAYAKIRLRGSFRLPFQLPLFVLSPESVASSLLSSSTMEIAASSGSK